MRLTVSSHISMYFWAVEDLKAAMADQPLTSRQELPYIVATVILTTVVTVFATPVLNLWDAISASLMVVLAVGGTIYIYHRNGGPDGHHFLQRFIALGWVVTVRMLVLFFAIGLGFYLLLNAAGVSSLETTWYDAVIYCAAEAFAYWRVGCHVGDLAERARRSEQARRLSEN